MSHITEYAQLKLGNNRGYSPIFKIPCLKLNKHNSLHFAKYSQIFVLGHYVFLKLTIFSSFAFGTDNDRRQYTCI